MVWVCQMQLAKLSKGAVQAIEESELRVSPIVLLELTYLHEIMRIIQPAQVLFQQLEIQIGLKLCDHAFPAVIQTALFETWTRDPFDRVIVAHAKSNGYAPLVTPDVRIRENYSNAVW